MIWFEYNSPIQKLRYTPTNEPNAENKVPIFCATWVNEKNSQWVIDKVLIGTDNYTFNIGELETACLLPIEKFRDLEVKAYCYKE
jgi:hypothetical protein